MEKRKMEFNTAVLLDKQFNHPHTSYPIIHVAGTDGKGSTSSMIASILIEAGYKVGTFNTPGIHGRRSTIRINGETIQKNKIKRIIRKINTVAKKNNIPIIRWVNIYAESAFLYFKNEHVDIAVVEVCKGGQTDPTNVVKPIISVLTNITPDHLDVFNNDFMTYANEKVGVIKNNVPIYVGITSLNEEVKNLIYQKSKDCNAPLIYTDNENNNFIIEQLGNGKYKTKFGDISMSLCGDYQYYNLNLALNVIQELKIKGYHIENEHIISGINSIYENTGFCGRWQILNETPLVILDAGHTYEAWKTVIPQLLKLNYNKLYIVSTIYTNRDANKITEMYPDNENIEYLFPMSYTNILRTPQELLNATMWMKKSKRHETKHITKILKPLLKNTKQDDVIFIMGSTVHIGTINDLFKNIK